ncbi:unnamed protein product [Gulo gulo]|uniref:Uncharacterized protein n=1 Tax=Gulo gulo TaxID=48420 RepID=A0A9X9Q6T3_GULGU|nr:unnamed protein product [Gulo gulo]
MSQPPILRSPQRPDAGQSTCHSPTKYFGAYVLRGWYCAARFSRRDQTGWSPAPTEVILKQETSRRQGSHPIH